MTKDYEAYIIQLANEVGISKANCDKILGIVQKFDDELMGLFYKVGRSLDRLYDKYTDELNKLPSKDEEEADAISGMSCLFNTDDIALGLENIEDSDDINTLMGSLYSWAND